MPFKQKPKKPIAKEQQQKLQNNINKREKNEKRNKNQNKLPSKQIKQEFQVLSVTLTVDLSVK